MASTGETWRLGHRPALDGLRGVAVLSVMVGHVWPSHAQVAIAGVLMFFTLSGFLITTLLLEERSRTGRIDLMAFYRRRALRLMPAAFAFLLVFAALGLAFDSPMLTWARTWPVLLYVENWAVVVGGHTGLVLHFWSLSVEEQFYIVWPLVMLLAARWGRRALAVVIVGGFIASSATLLFLMASGDSAQRIAYGTDTNAAAILVGCGLAVAMHSGALRQRARPVLAIFAVVLIESFFVLHSSLMRPVVPLATAVAIWALTSSDARLGWWESRALVQIGRRSYALYLWHTPLAFALLLGPLREAHIPEPLSVAIFASASWGLATLSWHFVEKPFLALKDGLAKTGRLQRREPEAIKRHPASAQ